MGIFNVLGSPNINEKVKEFQESKGSVLLDVRTTEEYREGHIQGSMNIPLNQLSRVASRIKEKDTKIYVYCLSGGRSAQAVSGLKGAGYDNVVNAGGINRYKGKVVR